MNINPAKFDSGWNRKRDAAVRLTAVLLSEDNAALERPWLPPTTPHDDEVMALVQVRSR